MRVSRMSVGGGALEPNGERMTAMDFGGPKSGGRAIGKYKQAPNFR